MDVSKRLFWKLQHSGDAEHEQTREIFQSNRGLSTTRMTVYYGITSFHTYSTDFVMILMENQSYLQELQLPGFQMWIIKF